jgi:hypothetical protein
MGKEAKRGPVKLSKAMRRRKGLDPEPRRRIGTPERLLDPATFAPVDIELLALKQLLEECYRLSRPARLYLAARLQEDDSL